MNNKYNYTYYFDEKNRTIICVSSFAGKKYRGIAKCAPEDTYDEEYGRKLATARCAAKIAKAKVRYATARGRKATAAFSAAMAEVLAAEEYKDNAYAELEEACNVIADMTPHRECPPTIGKAFGIK